MSENNLTTYIALFWVLSIFAFIIFLIYSNAGGYKYYKENNTYCENIGYKYDPKKIVCYKENEEYNNILQRYTFKKIPENLSDVS